MRRFHGGNAQGGFSALLRSAKNKSIQMPQNNKIAGAMPNRGGSAGNRPGDNQTARSLMDAKNGVLSRPGAGSASRRRSKPWVDKPSVRIVEGSPGTSGREIHHATKIHRKGSVPAHHAIGANRTNFSKGRTGMHKGSTGLSSEVTKQHGVPGHKSVINRGIVPRGGYKHGASAARVSNLAKKLSFHSSTH